MDLGRMPPRHLARAVSSLDSREGWIGVILINGEKLYGQLPRETLFEGDKLNLALGGQSDDAVVKVPSQHISGIFPFDMSQHGDQVSTLDGGNDSVELWMSSWTRNAAEKYDYEIEESEIEEGGVVYDLTFSHEIHRGGEVEFETKTPLYCDWNYLTQKQGGDVNSVGASAFGFGGSVGWQSSLWSDFEDTIETKSSEIENIAGDDDVALSGYVDFIEVDDELWTEKMEGVEWAAAVISADRPDTTSDLEDEEWTIGYFRDDSFMFPRRHWDKITDEVQIFGEVVNTELETPAGTVGCYVKARAGAYLD